MALAITFLVTLVIIIVTFVSTEYFRYKQHIKWNAYISDAKTKLKNAGLRFNHSYQLVNKKDNSQIRFLRIFELKYNPNDKKVYGHCYITTKEGDIGTWYNDYKYLLDIPTRWNLTDNGEWNPNN